MKFTYDGISIDDDTWASASPFPCDNQDGSYIKVEFNGSPPVCLTEKFLIHALGLLKFDANCKKYTECVDRIEQSMEAK